MITGPIYDKLGYERKLNQDTLAATTALARTTLQDSPPEIITTHRHGKSKSRSTSPHRPYTIARPIPKSRWQQIVLHAGSAAGTTAAVVSEESMKCLKYCLEWLHYAIQHIEQQMNLLRNFLVSLATTSTSTSKHMVKPDNSVLASIKKEIVNTLRKVVEVVSKYAGSGLPEQAKAAVRSFILQLPSRWAILNRTTTQTSTEQEPLHETSIKLLDFSSESVDMLNSIHSIFSDTVERAELWLKRLKLTNQ
jgi:hypothetical protein